MSLETVLKAMKEEIDRSKKLKISGFDAPFFIQYHLRKKNVFKYRAEDGALYENTDDSPDYELRAEVRVGDYHSNSFGVAVSTTLPLDEEDMIGLKYQLWKITDSAYKDALENYLENQKTKVRKVNKKKELDDFTQEEPVVEIKKPKNMEINKKYWKDLVEEYSKTLRDTEGVLESNVRFDSTQDINFIVNTEGTELVFEKRLFKLAFYVSGQAKNKDKIERFKHYYGTSEEEMPQRPELKKDIPKMLEELEALKKAPLMKPVVCPAILDSSNHGTLWHETVSHRLEGGRLNNEKMVDKSNTFEGKIGEALASNNKLEFITIIDDPTKKSYMGMNLIGSYKYDDQGVKAQKIEMIKEGVLTNYLMSRSPVKGNEDTVFEYSNGHGRLGDFIDEEDNRVMAIARNGNLIVESSKIYTSEELKKMLIKEIKSGGYKFGLILKENYEGSTDLKAADMIRPSFIYKVFPDGTEELYRAKDLAISGTPLNTLSNIIATDDTYEVENGICGAESGWVPISIVAPAALLKKVELASISMEEDTDLLDDQNRVLPPPKKN